MKLKLIIALLFVVGFFWWLPQPDEGGSKSSSLDSLVAYHDLNNNFIIRNANIYDGFTQHVQSDLLVENNRVVAVGESLANPKSYKELDAKGKTVLPGLIDAHTHVWGDALTQAINFGVTTELDMFTSPETAELNLKSRDDVENNQAADLFSATILATAPGGHGTEYGMEIPVLSEVSQVKAFVEKRVADGADYIKAVYNAKEARRQHFPSISREILNALAAEAKSHEKMLVVHVDNLISAKHAIESGASGIIHSFMDVEADKQLIDMMVTNNAFIIPTFTVQASITGQGRGKALAEIPVMKAYMSSQQSQQLNVNFGNFSIPKFAFKNSQRSVLKMQQAGITVLAGSDAPNPGTTHGVSLHDELVWLVEAGLTTEQAIHAATGAVGKVFPVNKRGTLVAGALASIVLIDGNPFETIQDSIKIEAIWKNGFHLKRKTYDLDRRFGVPLAAADISDFSQSDEATLVGAGISTSTDQLAGGKSTVAKQLASRGNEGDRFLQVTGEVIKGFSYPWSGIAFVPGNSFQEGANLSELSHFVFDAKGNVKEQPLSVLVFQAGSFTPAVRQLNISTDWQTYKVSLTDFDNIDIRQVVNISIVATAPFGKFEFGVDNLKFE